MTVRENEFMLTKLLHHRLWFKISNIPPPVWFSVGDREWQGVKTTRLHETARLTGSFCCCYNTNAKVMNVARQKEEIWRSQWLIRENARSRLQTKENLIDKARLVANLISRPKTECTKSNWLHLSWFKFLQILDLSPVQLVYSSSYFKSLSTGGNVSKALVRNLFFVNRAVSNSLSKNLNLGNHSDK